MRLLDDPITPNLRPLSRVIMVMAGSGQIEGHHFTKTRFNRMSLRVLGWCAAFLSGLELGWIIWSGQ